MLELADPITEPFLARPDDASEVRRLLREGLLVAVLPGVYRAARAPDDPRSRVVAMALLVLPRLRAAGAVVAQEAAAWLAVGGPAPPALDLYLPARCTRRGRPPLRMHQLDLPAADIEQAGPLRVTGPVRTAADLARQLPAEQALPLLGRLRERAGVRPADVLSRLERMPRCRGVPRARATVADWSVRLSSQGLR